MGYVVEANLSFRFEDEEDLEDFRSKYDETLESLGYRLCDEGIQFRFLDYEKHSKLAFFMIRSDGKEFDDECDFIVHMMRDTGWDSEAVFTGEDGEQWMYKRNTASVDYYEKTNWTRIKSYKDEEEEE